MGGTGPASNMWHADHVVLAAYRWLTWGVTALWLVGQGRMATYGGALVATLLVTLALTALARHYVAQARHTPAIMGLDILLVVAAIIASGGWESPFFFYASSALVLPGLLYGWLGGVMAGLTFVAVNLTALVAIGHPPSDRLFEGAIAGLTVLLTMLVPPTFGALFPLMVEYQRGHHGAAGPGPEQRQRPSSDDLPQGGPASAGREGRLLRESRRSKSEPRVGPEVAPLTRTRTAEPSVEGLRRVIFAPMPAPNLELGALLDVLVARYGQQTGTSARLAVIGRSRSVRPIYRDLIVRLAQEALINIEQHAHASSVSLTLRYDINTAQLLIQDDGVGLAEGTYERPGLRALRAMHYRIAEFGGRLDVFETEGGGVTVRATMPIE